MYLSSATGKHRARRISSLVGAFSVVVSLTVSCGGAKKFDLTLRVRDYDGASAVNLELQWLAADGRHATSPPISGLFPIGGTVDIGAVDCGGQRWPRRFSQVLGLEQAPPGYSFELEIDDGNRLTLDPQRAVVVSSPYQEIDCLEETGRWQGTAGHMRNHEGTFTMHYDSIQTTLRLVED